MFLLQRTMAQNLAELLKLLEGEYLVAEGLMVSFANRKILLKFVAKIDNLYEKIMLECQSLGENDVLPDSDNITKSSVIKDKVGFAERVREWRMSAEYAESSSTSGAELTDQFWSLIGRARRWRLTAAPALAVVCALIGPPLVF